LPTEPVKVSLWPAAMVPASTGCLIDLPEAGLAIPDFWVKSPGCATAAFR
jgi:hypothetical protein